MYCTVPGSVEVDLADLVPPDGVDLAVRGGHGRGGSGTHGTPGLQIWGCKTDTDNAGYPAELKTGYSSCRVPDNRTNCRIFFSTYNEILFEKNIS